jgi:hypothetical protein
MIRSIPTCALLVAATALLAASAVAPALADETACGKRDKLLGTLAQSYQEKPAAIGLSQDGSLVELLTSADGATWTILVTLPNGTSCIATAGQDWQPLISSAMVPTAYEP